MEIEIRVESEAVQLKLESLRHLLADMTPIMRSVAMELVSQTEENFEAEGRPKWPVLAKSTEQQRERQGKWPGQILQVSGALARGVTPLHGADFAQVGVAGVPYAAIHQFGGNAGRGHKAKIPARPYLPVLGGKLQPAAEEAILDILETKITQMINA